MKKLLAFFLVSVLMLLAVACGMSPNDGKIPGEGDPTIDNGTAGDQNTPGDMIPDQSGENNTSTSYQNANELLEKIWTQHSDAERFPIMGGDYDNIVDNAPGAFDLSHPEAAANLDSLYAFPPAEIGKIDSAAGMIHGMNANIFTCGAFRIKQGNDINACAEQIKNHVLSKQFLCGSPENLAILSLPGNYLISVFGTTDAVTSFVQKTKGLIDDVTVVTEQQIAR